MDKYELPTGYLLVDDYSKGKLETLTIGDYGKKANVKANFLGYNSEIQGVANQPCMPLSEKWVMTLSTQYGCVMKCNFCDVPNVPFRGNASVEDMHKQILNAASMFPNVGYTERLNIHYARMGDPIFNNAVFDLTEELYHNKAHLPMRVEVLHPVLTTSLPAALKSLEGRLQRWCSIKNDLYNGQAGLQISVNTTDEAKRTEMFGGMSLTLEEFAAIADKLPVPIGRKYCLNFAYASGNEVDGAYLATLFDPEKFMCKVTPIHNNNACIENGIETISGYDSYLPYKYPEEELMSAGFDTLVFIPSLDEEDGLVTCGNAILGDSKLKLSNPKLSIEGQV